MQIKTRKKLSQFYIPTIWYKTAESGRRVKQGIYSIKNMKDIFSAIVVGSYGMFAVPILCAIMSKMTSPDRQGTIFVG